jgi:hypothetical protein
VAAVTICFWMARAACAAVRLALSFPKRTKNPAPLCIRCYGSDGEPPEWP